MFWIYLYTFMIDNSNMVEIGQKEYEKRVIRTVVIISVVGLIIVMLLVLYRIKIILDSGI